MLNARGRDIGEPIVRSYYITPTPELVASTRANIERAMSNIESQYLGTPVLIRIDWEGHGVPKKSRKGR